MKILYIHQYFKTPEEGGPIRSYYLAKGLVDKGHEVEMITSYNGAQKITKNVDGIKVHYLPIYYDNALSFKRRMIAFLKFMYMAIDEVTTIKNIDLCYASSTPLTVGMAAIKIKERFGIPYYFEVRDLWPEAPIQMGAIKNPWLMRYTQDLEQRIYDEANKIVALSPGMRNGILDKAHGKEVILIPNMSDIDFFNREEKDPVLEDKFDAVGKFIISYFGAMGKANHLEYLLDTAASSLAEGLSLKYLIVGEGAERERLHALSKKRKLQNVSFLPFMNKTEIRELLNITDAAYISFDKKPILETNSPNKFFDALASGKMVVTNTKGWLRELSEKHGCGFYTDPENPVDFLEKIEPFISKKELLQQYQHNARKLGESQFAKNDQVEALVRVLEI